MATHIRLIIISFLAAIFLPPSPVQLPPNPPQSPIELVSGSIDSRAGDGWSFRPTISADGRYIAFASSADDLINQDKNHTWDIFRRDLQTGETILVSIANDGTQGNGPSGFWSTPSISADGRWVAYASLADNLVPEDHNQAADVFLHDCVTGKNWLISHDTGDLPANGWSDWPAVSQDGRFVSFTSLASNLVSGDQNNARDIFRFDRDTGKIEIVSVSSAGEQGNRTSGWASAISSNGEIIAFASSATNLVDQDNNHSWDVFVRDIPHHSTERVSLRITGDEGNADSGFWSPIGLSADGNLVVFQTDASNLVYNDTNHLPDIYVFDRSAQKVQRVSVSYSGEDPDGPCVWPTISPDGRFVAFTCLAKNMVPVDRNNLWDVFVRDRLNHITQIVSTAPDASAGTNHSGYWTSPALSRDGRVAAFASFASNFTARDKNNTWDVFAVNLASSRGTAIVREALLDLGMPYCTLTDTQYRGCSGSTPCDGPYHQTRCGVCTDLVLDAVRAAAGYDLQAALQADAKQYPAHSYPWGDMRNANEMWAYFQYTNQVLKPDDPYIPGDFVFFDWNGDQETDHVAIIAEVTENGTPLALVDATGKIDQNPGGLTSKMPWQSFYQQSLVGHVRLGGSQGILPITK